MVTSIINVELHKIEHDPTPQFSVQDRGRIARGTDPGGVPSLVREEMTVNAAISQLQLSYARLFNRGINWGERVVVQSRTPMARLWPASIRLGKLVKLGRAIRHPLYESLVERRRLVVLPIHPLELLEKDLYCRFMPLGRVAHNVILEIPDSPMLGEVHQLERRLISLRHLGYRICIGGFDSSDKQVVLEAKHVDFIRLGPSLVDGIERYPAKQELLLQVISKAHDSRTEVLACGIENKAQFDILSRLGCDVIEVPR